MGLGACPVEQRRSDHRSPRPPCLNCTKRPASWSKSVSLVAFASISDPSVHVLRYPNGDLTHCFAIWFLAEHWSGTPIANGTETVGLDFFHRDALPQPLMVTARLALDLYDAFVETGRFQAR